MTLNHRRGLAIIGCLGLATAFGAVQASGPGVGDGSPADAKAAALGQQDRGDVIRLDGGRTVVRHWADGYAVSVDGGATWREVTNASFALMLRYASFDPLANVPMLPESLQAVPPVEGEVRPYIVQFVSQPLDAFRREVRDAGGTIYNFLAPCAYIVHLDDQALARVSNLEFVRWVGEYEPAYKLEEYLLDAVRQEQPLPAMKYNIMVFEKGPRHKAIIADDIVALGGEITNLIPQGYIVEASLTLDQVLAIAHLPEVMWIDRTPDKEPDLWLAREITGVDYIEGFGGWDGDGVRAEVMDGNLLGTHQDFQNNPPIFHANHSGDASHGTRTYGELFGDGTGNPDARGFLPAGQGIFADYGWLTNRYQHTQELLQSPYEAVFQSNSWGGSRTTQYTSESTQMDDIIFDFDIIITQSQSNSGNQSSRPQAWAKNIVSVGGVNGNRTLTKSDDWWGGASIGPAADGRIKPDLVHFYDGVTSTSSTGGYASICCTSGATPLVAGSFGLFFDMWADGIFGNEVDGTGQAFSNRPHASTAKAILVNTADPYPFSGTGHNLTRTHQGWGMPDLFELYDARGQMLIVNETDVLEELETATYELTVPADTPQFRATLVYSDPAGTTSSSLHRINDLSLRVTAPSGDEMYWGNNGLATGIWSVAGGAEDTRNNVENVFVENPEPGVWTVEVLASELNQDGHVETNGVVDADFALVVQGIVPPAGAASINQFAILHGTLNSGGIDSLRESDDDHAEIISAPGFQVTEANLVRARVHMTSPQSSPTAFDILFEAKLDHPGGTGKIMLRDWSAPGVFETVDTYPMSQTDEAHLVTDVDPTDHVRGSDRKILMEYRHFVVATFTVNGFRSSTDHIEVIVR